MRPPLNLALGLLLGLFDLVVRAIALVEGFVRRLLAGAGIVGPLQTVILTVLLACLIVAAFRAFGRLLGVLVAVVLLLLLAHAVTAGLPRPA